MISPVFNSLGGKSFNPAQSYMDWMSFCVSTQSSDKRRFSRCSATALATTTFSTPVHIVDLDQATNLHFVIGIFHDQLQFVLHPQRGSI